jgi:uroporphyrinogen decarboxylase
MNSMQRVLATLSGQEPDRVPLFLLTSLQGAKALGLSIKDYFAKPEHVVEGQLKLWHRYQSDCLCPFHYASLEIEAFGGKTFFYPDGPPNCQAPILAKPADIDRLEAPCVDDAPGLARVLAATRQLKTEVGDSVPIIGAVIAPFSLPVMQLGFGP